MCPNSVLLALLLTLLQAALVAGQANTEQEQKLDAVAIRMQNWLNSAGLSGTIASDSLNKNDPFAIEADVLGSEMLPASRFCDILLKSTSPPTNVNVRRVFLECAMTKGGIAVKIAKLQVVNDATIPLSIGNAIGLLSNMAEELKLWADDIRVATIDVRVDHLIVTLSVALKYGGPGYGPVNPKWLPPGALVDSASFGVDGKGTIVVRVPLIRGIATVNDSNANASAAVLNCLHVLHVNHVADAPVHWGISGRDGQASVTMYFLGGLTTSLAGIEALVATMEGITVPRVAVESMGLQRKRVGDRRLWVLCSATFATGPRSPGSDGYWAGVLNSLSRIQMSIELEGEALVEDVCCSGASNAMLISGWTREAGIEKSLSLRNDGIDRLTFERLSGESASLTKLVWTARPR